MSRIINLTGRRFGRLTAQSYAKSPGRRSHWVCVCDCGKTVAVEGGNLRSGHTASCGCLGLESSVKNLPSNATHRMTRCPTYKTWRTMKARCSNPRNASYAHYGGRGVQVCGRWEQSFENFLSDMGPRPSLKHQIDRVDSNGNYEPGNCRWATIKTQNRNKSDCRMVAIGEDTRCVSEWAEQFGMNSQTVHARLDRGWTLTEALTRPVRRLQQPAR